MNRISKYWYWIWFVLAIICAIYKLEHISLVHFIIFCVYYLLSKINQEKWVNLYRFDLVKEKIITSGCVYKSRKEALKAADTDGESGMIYCGTIQIN